MGGWVGWIEENEAIRMGYCKEGFGWVGGWVDGWVVLSSPTSDTKGPSSRPATQGGRKEVGGWVVE